MRLRLGVSSDPAGGRYGAPPDYLAEFNGAALRWGGEGNVEKWTRERTEKERKQRNRKKGNGKERGKKKKGWTLPPCKNYCGRP